MVMGTTGIKDTHTALLYELAFAATGSSWMGDPGI